MRQPSGNSTSSTNPETGVWFTVRVGQLTKGWTGAENVRAWTEWVSVTWPPDLGFKRTVAPHGGVSQRGGEGISPPTILALSITSTWLQVVLSALFD